MAQGEATPTKYWLTTVDPDMSLRCLVDLAKRRWRVERDYEDLKQEIGLANEGRGSPGFHHHGTLAIAAYGFLISERGTIPPSGCAAPIKKSPLPSGYRPRGRARSGRTAASPIRSPRSVESWPPRLQTNFTDFRTVCAACAAVRDGITNTVVLAGPAPGHSRDGADRKWRRCGQVARSVLNGRQTA
jgi:hypothetical protein